MMVGENGVPETPDWQPESRAWPSGAFWDDLRADMTDPEFRAAFEAAEKHIERGDN